MTGTTSDRNDPRLTRGVDDAPVPMADAYLVLSDEDRAKGFVRPVRRTYVHITCGTATTMGQAIAETYARDPKFYGATFCVRCSMHRHFGHLDAAGNERVTEVRGMSRRHLAVAS